VDLEKSIGGEPLMFNDMLNDLSLQGLISSLMSKETLFALSLFPYLGFLWFLEKSGQTPKLVLRGFYLLLVFVVVTIPAGIYAKVAYGAELANVDWLHGSAESFLTLSNVVVVWGFSQALSSASYSASIISEDKILDSNFSKASGSENLDSGNP
jgi:Protein of unknown function (DUF3593)